MSYAKFSTRALCILLVYSLPNCSCHFGRTYEGRVVGGEPVNAEKYPFAVQFYNLGSLCAGTILSSWIIVTAAHCFDHNKETDDMVIRTGTTALDPRFELYNVLNFTIHLEYNKTAQFACDIALILVERPISFHTNTKKAVLVDSITWMKKRVDNFAAIGWGWTKYGGPVSKLGLMMTTLKFISTPTCSAWHQLTLTPDMFCLYGDGKRDTCKGDSGGGVFWKGMLVGITSFGDGCARNFKPSVYVNVWYFRDWIEISMNQLHMVYCSKNKTSFR